MLKPLQCVLFLLLLSATSLVAQTHVAEPAVNLGDTSFLDGIGGPGVVIEAIGDGAHAGSVVDGTGRPIQGAGAVNSISELTHIAWLSHKTVLGGWYGTEVVAAAAHVNAGSAGQSGGWGPSRCLRSSCNGVSKRSARSLSTSEWSWILISPWAFTRDLPL
jgi:hypothetical protein